MHWKRVFLWAFILLGLARPAPAQSSSSVAVESDIRLFTTIAAINAAGFDVEIGGQYSPVREAVRQRLRTLDPDLADRMRRFYLDRKGRETDDAQFPRYVSLALNLSDPPEFDFLLRRDQLPPDAAAVAEFVPLLREFYVKARIASLWAEFRPQYESSLNALAPALRDMFVRSDSYLRIPFGTPTSRLLSIYLELAATVTSVNVRNYRDNYFVVLGPTASPRLDDIRHAYLHFLLDSLVLSYGTTTRELVPLLGKVQGVEGVLPQYATDISTHITESLIRAVELRLDRAPADRARLVVDETYRAGLLLTPVFYDALAVFEAGVSGIRSFFREMIEKVALKDEQQRFEETFFKITLSRPVPVKAEVPVPAPAPPSDPIRDLLKQAEAAFNGNQNEQARGLFDRVLRELDPNHGAAHYGLGLLASRAGDSELARQHFLRAIESSSIEPGEKVWAHIYAGRIYDLECEREKAIEQYRLAIRFGDNTRNAQAIARQGIDKPFGDGCR